MAVRFCPGVLIMSKIEEAKSNIVLYEKHYSEKGLRRKLSRLAKRAGLKVAYCALLLFYVLKDPATSTADKSKIYGALGYFILPIDIIPDFTPIVGLSDDLSILLWALYAIVKNVTPNVKQMAHSKLAELFGKYDSELLEGIELRDKQSKV